MAFKNLDITKSNKKLLVIDGTNTFIRAMSVSKITNDNNVPIGGFSGFLMSMGYAIKLIKPTKCIIVFDGQYGSEKRKALFEGYKAKRKLKRKAARNPIYGSVENEDKAMKFQMSRLQKYLDNLPVTTVIVNNIEADDVISYIVDKYTDYQNYIMSTDQDFLQKINDHVLVYSPKKKIIFDRKKMLETFDIIPENFIFLKCFDGDESDEIPGVKGVGLITLQNRLPVIFGNEQINMNDIFDYLKTIPDEIKKYKVLQKINESRNTLELNYKLMILNNSLINEQDKLEIEKQLNIKTPFLNRLKILQLIMVDNVNAIIRNPTNWIDAVFTQLATHSVFK